MAVVKAKPTSPGRRFRSLQTGKDLYRGRPLSSLVTKKSKTGGRNNAGRITTRHIGGGHKQHYRIIDFKRNKDNIPAKVERIEYDSNRSAYIALLLYNDGERRYIIAPKNLKVNDQVISGEKASVNVGHTLVLKDIPVAIGFGISTPEHVKTVNNVADGAIVGSHLVKIITENLTNLTQAKTKFSKRVTALKSI